MNTGTTPRPLTHEELNDTLAAVRIPPCPAIVTEVMREAQRDEPSIKVLTRILASDVGMSAMAIKLANSPMFGSGAKVKSIQQAVARLEAGHDENVARVVGVFGEEAFAIRGEIFVAVGQEEIVVHGQSSPVVAAVPLIWRKRSR